MQNRKSVLLFLFGLSLTLWSGAVLGQQKPPTPPAPTNPAGLVTLNQAQGNPLLANPGAPRPKPVFRYSLIPYETLAPAVQLTPDQIAKVRPIYLKMDEDVTAVRAAAQKPQEKMTLSLRQNAVETEADRQIDAALEPSQRKKAESLIFEVAQFYSLGFSRPMLHDMKLAPDQRVAILNIEADVQKKVRALPQEERRAKYQSVMEAERVRIAPLLTPAQKAIFDRYDTHGRLIGFPKPGASDAPISVKTEPATPSQNPPAPEKKP